MSLLQPSFRLPENPNGFQVVPRLFVEYRNHDWDQSKRHYTLFSYQLKISFGPERHYTHLIRLADIALYIPKAT